MSQVYDEPIVVRLTVPVGPYPVGTEFGFKDVADAIRALGSSAYFTVVRTQDGDPIPPPTPEDLTEAERQALARARAARLIRGVEFDKLVPGPGEVIVGSADGPVATHRALTAPLPGTARLLPPPKVMASPPTVQILTTAQPRLIIGNDPALRYYRAIPSTTSSISATGISNGRLPLALDFMFDGQVFALRTRGQGGIYRFRINGEFVTKEYSAPLPEDQGTYYLTLDLGSRDVRHITVEMEYAAQVVGVSVGNSDTVWRTDAPLGPRVVAIGDSWARFNTGVHEWVDTWPHVMGAALGWNDVRAVGVGGSGYLQGAAYRGRIGTDVIPHDPNIVLISGGINDSSFSESQIRTEAGLLYDALRSALPSALLMVVGPWYYSDTNSPEIVAARKGVKDAADARGIPYIPTDNWITGTGQVGAEASTGNANLYIVNSHPTKAGQAYLGRRLATAITAQLGRG